MVWENNGKSDWIFRDEKSSREIKPIIATLEVDQTHFSDNWVVKFERFGRKPKKLKTFEDEDDALKFAEKWMRGHKTV